MLLVSHLEMLLIHALMATDKLTTIDLLSELEVGIGIIAGCLATCRPLLQRLIQLFASSSRVTSMPTISSSVEAGLNQDSPRDASQYNTCPSWDIKLGIPTAFQAGATTKELDSKEWNDLLISITMMKKSTIPPPTPSLQLHQPSDFLCEERSKTRPHHISENIPLPSFISHEGEDEQAYDEHDDLQRMNFFAESFNQWNRKEGMRSMEDSKPRQDSETLFGHGD